MKLWLKNTLWVIGVLTVLVVLRLVDSAQDARSMGLPQVNIDLFEDMMFLSEDDILNRLKDKG